MSGSLGFRALRPDSCVVGKRCLGFDREDDGGPNGDNYRDPFPSARLRVICCGNEL